MRQRLYRQLLIFAYCRLILYKSKAISIPRIRFQMDMMSTADCIHYFRFDASQIRMIIHYLQLNNGIVTSARDRVTGETAMCMFLYRLAYPARYGDIALMFGSSRERICRIFNHMLEYIFFRIRDFLFWNQRYMTPMYLQRLAMVVAEKCNEKRL
jgi:hypothetical protein